MKRRATSRSGSAVVRVAFGLGVLASAAAGAGACGDRAPDPHYVEPVAPPRWCRLAAGTYAFQWRPTTSPALLTPPCDPGAPPDSTRSTLAELVVEPGTAVDLEVTVPEGVTDCVVDSLVLAHGQRAGDLEIALTSAASAPRAAPPDAASAPPAAPPGSGAVPSNAAAVASGAGAVPSVPVVAVPSVPVVAYEKMPLAREPIVRDFPVAIARARASPSLLTEVTLTVDAVHGSTVKLHASVASGTEVEAVGAPREFMLVAARHIIGLPAPARTFALTLRARQTAFSIGVRSTAESSDPPLRFRPADGAPPAPTNLVPQAAVVLSHCKLRAAQALDLVEREYRQRPPPQVR